MQTKKPEGWLLIHMLEGSKKLVRGDIQTFLNMAILHLIDSQLKLNKVMIYTSIHEAIIEDRPFNYFFGKDLNKWINR
jgi:hypothetical protein